ncbi:MAG: alanyl-tRNA editing protein [Treponema sp.]|jgi:alanyl-tRNA synthetase|nr:alanyl-tRNA editing protein [Treponema sp.]
MKTAAAYYEYAAADPFSANILELRNEEDKTALILDKTIFYPEGGGQPSDRGSINGIPLLDVLEKNGEILHLVRPEDGSRLVPGPAELVLDLKRRRDFTVQHTAQHLLSGTILRLTGKHTVSMRLGEEINTIDVDTPQLDSEALAGAEDAVMDTIEADVPVIIHFCPPENIADFPLRKTPPRGEEVIRVVEIQGNDFSPCCGTHLKSAGRIGMLRVLGAEKYKGMTRVSFIAGRRVFQDSRILRQNGEVISRALKVPVAETGKAVLALIDRFSRIEKQVKELEEAAAQSKAKNLLHKARILNSRDRDAEKKEPEDTDCGRLKVFSINYSNSELEDLLHIGRAAQKLTSAVLVFFSTFLLKFAAFCSAEGVDIRPLLKDRMEALGGRGGGSASFFQGLFSSAENLDAFIASLPKEIDIT